MATLKTQQSLESLAKKMGGRPFYRVKYDYRFNASILLSGKHATVTVGCPLISRLLLDAPDGKKELYREVFANIMAHEIGHDIDPELRDEFASMHAAEKLNSDILRALTHIDFRFPLFLLAVAHSDADIAVALLLFVVVLVEFFIIAKVLKPLIFLHKKRRLEYNADRLSLTGVGDIANAPECWATYFSEADAYNRAQNSAAAQQAKAAIVSRTVSGLRTAAKTAFALACCYVVTKLNWLRTHPVDHKRVAQIKKHADAMMAARQAVPAPTGEGL